MPYFKYRSKRKYEYELANGQFTPEDLEPELRQVFDVLRDLRVRTVYCRYNGRGNEGFAQLNGVKLEDRTVKFDDLKQKLARGSLGSKTSDKYLCRYYQASYSGHLENPQGSVLYVGFTAHLGGGICPASPVVFNGTGLLLSHSVFGRTFRRLISQSDNSFGRESQEPQALQVFKV